MITRCEVCPLRKRSIFQQMSDDQVRQTQKFKVGELTIEANAPVLTEGTYSAQIFTVLSGMGLRHKIIENGRRQVLNFVLPGDLIGLQGAVMGEMGHTVEARTRMRLCVFDRASLWDFFKQTPARAYDLTWLAASEEQFLGEALATLGQCTAEQSVAWALTRLWARADALGMVLDGRMPLPFKQQDLADALGLSLVHTNKTLARFRERQLAVWRDGTLALSDVGQLARIGLTTSETPPVRPLL